MWVYRIFSQLGEYCPVGELSCILAHSPSQRSAKMMIREKARHKEAKKEGKGEKRGKTPKTLHVYSKEKTQLKTRCKLMLPRISTTYAKNSRKAHYFKRSQMKIPFL